MILWYYSHTGPVSGRKGTRAKTRVGEGGGEGWKGGHCSYDSDSFHVICEATEYYGDQGE